MRSPVVQHQPDASQDKSHDFVSRVPVFARGFEPSSKLDCKSPGANGADLGWKKIEAGEVLPHRALDALA